MGGGLPDHGGSLTWRRPGRIVGLTKVSSVAISAAWQESPEPLIPDPGPKKMKIPGTLTGAMTAFSVRTFALL